MYKNTIERARLINKLVEENYEPGRQDRCKLWVFRNIVRKIYPMTERTFFKYLRIAKQENQDKKQLTLFNYENTD